LIGWMVLSVMSNSVSWSLEYFEALYRKSKCVFDIVVGA